MPMSMSDLITKLTGIMSEAGNVMVEGVDEIAHVVSADVHSVAIMRSGESAPPVQAAPDAPPPTKGVEDSGPGDAPEVESVTQVVSSSEEENH